MCLAVFAQAFQTTWGPFSLKNYAIKNAEEIFNLILFLFTIVLSLLIIGIIGIRNKKQWGVYSMLGSLAISVYWPLVHLFAIYNGKAAFSLGPDKYLSYSIILPLIIIYGLWGMWYLYNSEYVHVKKWTTKVSSYSDSLCRSRNLSRASL